MTTAPTVIGYGELPQTEIPSESAVNTKLAELQTAWDLENDSYKSKRAAEYAPLKEQFDLLYKDMLADKGDKTGEWFKAIKKVKDDNPKG